MKLFFLNLFFSTTVACIGQEIFCPLPDVHINLIEKVPIYPGCSGNDNEFLKKCLADSISTLIQREFNLKIESEESKSGTNRVYANFIIDENGEVVTIKARGTSIALENEAVRIIQMLPKMTPGQQGGRNVRVVYNLPITFD